MFSLMLVKKINSMRNILFFGMVLLVNMTKAQENNIRLITPRLAIIQDYAIDNLIVKKKMLNRQKMKEHNNCIPYPKNGLAPGYKIQLDRFKTKVEADACIEKFSKIFPTIDASIRYETPNYKVYVGHYLSMEDMEKDLDKIRRRFRGSFSVQTSIYIEKEIWNKEYCPAKTEKMENK